MASGVGESAKLLWRNGVRLYLTKAAPSTLRQIKRERRKRNWALQAGTSRDLTFRAAGSSPPGREPPEGGRRVALCQRVSAQNSPRGIAWTFCSEADVVTPCSG